MKDGDEVDITDKLLVTSKKPPSLAKFLTTSMAFRKTVGNAQVDEAISFVNNFGWAPQRFTSRARPYARESRRWNVIFNALAEEAVGPNRDRRVLGRLFLGELGGEHSSRLVLGGLLADLSAEHYLWVATGDKRNPDTTTVQSRAEAFVDRLDQLFTKGMILTLPDTYTGVTLKFLRETTYYKVGAGVQTVGIGDWEKDSDARSIIKTALARVQVIVANMKEYMKLYRPEESWLQDFAAFRLPCPVSSVSDSRPFGGTSEEWGRDQQVAIAVKASWRKICNAAQIPEQKAIAQLLKVLPRAEKHFRDGASVRAAWGRAAAEWSELSSARLLVSLFLVWKTSTGNVERRFRKLAQTRCPERAQMLEMAVEDVCMVDQVPPSQEMARVPTYIQQVLKLHERLHVPGKTRLRQAERRDAGIRREPVSGNAAGGPETEAAFGRKRAAAITELMAVPPAKRAQMIRAAPLGFAPLAQEVATESARNPAPAASAQVVERVAKKRKMVFHTRYAKGAELAEKARKKRDLTVVQSATQRRRDEAPARKPGFALISLQDTKGRRKAQELGFRLVADPVDFVKKVVSQAASEKGNVVLNPPTRTPIMI